MVLIILSPRVSFGLIRIPRDEVKEIHRVIMEELDELQPGCVSTIVGGWVLFPFFFS